MQCPFIRDTHARSCRAAGIRKLIPETSGQAATGRCVSGTWRNCPWSAAAAHEPDSLLCPLMDESLVQYCAAAPVTRFIPYSEPLLSRCGSDAYRYCELYLDVMRASRQPESATGALQAPEGLLYSRNHWWLDASGDGPCHLGVDAFLSRLLGPVERIGFATPHGIARPTAILTIHGTDFAATFPELIPIDAPNLHLRCDPMRLTAEPYSLGWIYEGLINADQRRQLRESMLDAAAAAERMEEDASRLNQWVQSRGFSGEGAFAADGGLFAPGLLAMLHREEALIVFNEFCPPVAPDRRPQAGPGRML